MDESRRFRTLWSFTFVLLWTLQPTHCFVGTKLIGIVPRMRIEIPSRFLKRPSCSLRLFESKEDNNGNDSSAHLVFPGGGLFFYWQAGVVTYLRENGYDLSQVTLSGASAGALTATLAATNVDFYQATELALKLSQEAGVWDRKGGLQGIWGPMIESWLLTLLPENCTEMVNDRVSALDTAVCTD